MQPTETDAVLQKREGWHCQKAAPNHPEGETEGSHRGTYQTSVPDFLSERRPGPVSYHNRSVTNKEQTGIKGTFTAIRGSSQAQIDPHKLGNHARQIHKIIVISILICHDQFFLPAN
jgi:hypothetical protein